MVQVNPTDLNVFDLNVFDLNRGNSSWRAHNTEKIQQHVYMEFHLLNRVNLKSYAISSARKVTCIR